MRTLLITAFLIAACGPASNSTRPDGGPLLTESPPTGKEGDACSHQGASSCRDDLAFTLGCNCTAGACKLIRETDCAGGGLTCGATADGGAVGCY